MTQFTLPTSRRITQEWGQDFNWLNGKHYPNGFYATIGWLGHNGIDYGCPEGDEVEAVCDGVIEYVGPGNNHPLLTGGGNALLLRNDEMGIRFEYLHLSQQNVYTGQRVKRGQVIARSGNTGISSGAHLHLGAIPVKPNLNNGYRGRVDPTGWLYGPSNPDYAGIAAQGTTTPVQEDDMAFTPEQEKFILASLTSLVDNVATKKDVASRGQIDFTEAALRSLVENVATKADLSGVSAAVANAVGAKATKDDIEAAVRAGMSAGLKVDVTVK